jgi:hypothetical protein
MGRFTVRPHAVVEVLSGEVTAAEGSADGEAALPGVGVVQEEEEAIDKSKSKLGEFHQPEPETMGR